MCLSHQVHSGDQISVAVPGDPVGQERRLALSSIRAPRVGNPRRGVEDEPWAVEAKEALRKLAIGKTVKVVVDYQRDIPQTSGGDLPPLKRAFATVNVGSSGKSLQETLVETGMAAVARLRQDDPRTEHYDAIVAAEATAKAAKKGVHSGGGLGGGWSVGGPLADRPPCWCWRLCWSRSGASKDKCFSL